MSLGVPSDGTRRPFSPLVARPLGCAWRASDGELWGGGNW